jgi:outer membrane receptor protein involved in Fe transport
MFDRRSYGAVCVAVAALQPVGTALASSNAEDATQQSLAEIVVTAQKRESTLQSTPISISAVTGADLEARGIVDLTTLVAVTPGVSVKNNGPGQAEFEMRGMTSSGGNSPTVGFYLDDIPMTAPSSAQNGKVVIDPTLYDLNRVEVLRGPQGTLYGAGSMGGTVKLITNQPDLTGFHASAQTTLSGTHGGGFNDSINFMLNIPLITDQLALRIVGADSNTSGWIDRIVVNPFPLPTSGGAVRGIVAGLPVVADDKGSNAEWLEGTRVTLLWKPSDNLSITPSVFFQKVHQGGTSSFDSNPGTLAHYQPFSIAEPYLDKIGVYDLNIDYRAESFEVTSVTAQWNRTSAETQDGSENFNNPLSGVEINAPGTIPFYGAGGTGPAYGTEIDPSRQFSEELRAASLGNGALKWVAGLYYSRFWSSYNLIGFTPNPSAFIDLGTLGPATATQVWNVTTPTKLSQYALFGEATYAITEQLKATVGLRGFHYQDQFSQYFAGWGSPAGGASPSQQSVAQSQTGTTPKFNLAYEFDKDHLVYATIAKGFRPGGGDPPLPTSGPLWANLALNAFHYPSNQWPRSYAPDTVWSYEVGQKSRFLERRVTVDASAYYEDWQHIQLEELPNDYPLTDNNGTAKIYGGELEIHALLGAGFQLALSGGYTHGSLEPNNHYTIVPGNKLSDIAPVTADVNLGYSRQIDSQYAFKARLETSYVGERYNLTFPAGYATGALTRLPSYSLTSIRAGIQSGAGWEASLFANNLFNRQTSLENITQLTLANPSFNRVITSQPLTVGVDIAYRY